MWAAAVGMLTELLATAIILNIAVGDVRTFLTHRCQVVRDTTVSYVRT